MANLCKYICYIYQSVTQMASVNSDFKKNKSGKKKQKKVNIREPSEKEQAIQQLFIKLGEESTFVADDFVNYILDNVGQEIYFKEIDVIAKKYMLRRIFKES